MTEGHDDRGIEVERLEGLRFPVRLECIRGAYRQTQRVGQAMDGRLALLLAAARRLGRARVDCHHVVAGIDQRLERGDGKFRRAEKRDLHCRIL